MSHSIDVLCRLVQRGPYRYIRHPGYTGALVSFFGMWAFFGLRPLSLLWWILYAAPFAMIMVSGNLKVLCGLHVVCATELWATGWMQVRRIPEEEATLHQHFGKEYADYCRRTWRLLPPVL